jgi:hypothetical protein
VSRGETERVGTLGLILKLHTRGTTQEFLGVSTITGSFDEDAARKSKLDRKAMQVAWLSVCRRSEIRVRERQRLQFAFAASFILLEP